MALTLPRTLLVALAVLSCAGAPTQAQSTGSSEAPPQHTVLDGVYTDAQAARGEDVWWDVCSGCHEDGDFLDPAFHEKWADKPLYFLFKDIRNLMPDDNPGVLTRQEVADALAYILKVNRFPAGDTELSTEDDPLREILWKMPPSGGR